MASEPATAVLTPWGRVREIVLALLFVLLTVGLYLVGSVAVSQAGLVTGPARDLDDPQLIVGSLLALAATLGGTVILCLITREPVGAAGFADRRGGSKAALGFALGGVIVALAVVIPFLAGKEGLSGPLLGSGALIAAGVRDLIVLAPQSAAEEIFLRGYALQHLARGIGKPSAVLVTGTIFGVLHLGNPDASWVAAANIALVGVLLGVLVFKTGSIWFSMGLHISWNWFEGYFFGHPVSGLLPGVSLFRRTWTRSFAWTGSGFGPEASVPTVVILAILLVAALAYRTKPK